MHCLGFWPDLMDDEIKELLAKMLMGKEMDIIEVRAEEF